METPTKEEIRVLRHARADAHAAAIKARAAVTRAYNAMREAEIAAEAAIKATEEAKFEDVARMLIARMDLAECKAMCDELLASQEHWVKMETVAMRLFNELPMDGL